ncbi:MAG TPA: hypothetical protein DCY74_05665 [Clostridiales bacterium]|nr:hypothetical protein [Clostridiales bacterium]
MIPSLSYEELTPLILSLFEEGKDVEFIPTGNSMRPLLQSGENRVILTKPKGKLKKYDIPFFRRHNGQYVLHRIIGVKDRGYLCCGDGQITKEYPVTDSMIIGVVKGYYQQNGKYVDVNTSLVYRVYTRLWVFSRPVRALPARIKRMFRK